MADCQLTKRCPIFNDKMKIDAATSAAFKAKYCQGNNADCARFTLFRNNQGVPPDLLPDMMDRANEILAGK